MKTTTLSSLLFFFASFVGCDSATDTAPTQFAGKGSSFTFTDEEFDANSNIIDSKLTTMMIDADNITLESRTDVMRASSETDTLLFVRDADRSFLIYRPEVTVFEGITIEKRWQPILKEHTTDVIEISNFSGTVDHRGMSADVTIRETEQYKGTSTMLIAGKEFEVIRKSFTTEVVVTIPMFGVTATTSVTDTYGFAPELGFIVFSEQTRSSDSGFSPVEPGRTELTLSSYSIE